MRQEILNEGNDLLAAFLEWYREDGVQEDRSWFFNDEFSKYPIYSPYKEIYIGLPFHQSWNWFMDHVVAKIESLGYTFIVSEKPSIWHKDTFDWIRSTNTETFRQLKKECTTKLELNWLYAVEFVKWYNQKN